MNIRTVLKLSGIASVEEMREAKAEALREKRRLWNRRSAARRRADPRYAEKLREYQRQYRLKNGRSDTSRPASYSLAYYYRTYERRRDLENARRSNRREQCATS